MALLTLATRHVKARIRSGSSSPVVVETAGGRFVAKLRGAGHGISALIAEIIVAELAERLELSVPERVLIELLPDFESEDRNDELADLLRSSVGTNLGFRLLEGAREPRTEELEALDDEFVARVLWLDGLTMNPDRSVRNPNILFWNHRPWLIPGSSSYDRPASLWKARASRSFPFAFDEVRPLPNLVLGRVLLRHTGARRRLLREPRRHG